MASEGYIDITSECPINCSAVGLQTLGSLMVCIPPSPIEQQIFERTNFFSQFSCFLSDLLALQVAFFTSNKTSFNFGLEYCINGSIMSPRRMFPTFRARVFSSSFVVLVMSKVFRKSTSSPNRTPLIDSASNPHSFSTSRRSSTSSFTLLSKVSVASTSFTLYSIIASISHSWICRSKLPSYSCTFGICKSISISFKLFCCLALQSIIIRSNEQKQFEYLYTLILSIFPVFSELIISLLRQQRELQILEYPSRFILLQKCIM